MTVLSYTPTTANQTRGPRRFRVLALGLAAPAVLLLSGCIDLAPRYHRPAAPTPAAFPTGAAYPAVPIQPRPLVGWRDFFSDPKLRTVIEQALTNNRDLRVAVANIAAARAQYHIQRAALFPTVSAQAGATYGQEPTAVLGRGVPGATSYNEHIFSVTGASAPINSTCSARCAI